MSGWPGLRHAGRRPAANPGRPILATLPTVWIVVEGTMKRDRRMRRELLATSDGQRRWDRAYQALLTWTCTDEVCPTTVGRARVGKERDDAGRDLCAGVDTAPGAGADD